MKEKKTLYLLQYYEKYKGGEDKAWVPFWVIWNMKYLWDLST